MTLTIVNDDSSIVLPLGRWDSLATANSYAERTVALDTVHLPEGMQWRFIWEVLRDSTNSTGVLRVDDITISTAPTVDLIPLRVTFVPARIRAGESFNVVSSIRNDGRRPVVDAQLRIGWRGPSGPTEEITRTFGIAGGGSAIIIASLPPQVPGDLTVTAVVMSPYDEQPANDTLRTSIYVGIPPSAVVVNEFQFAPLRENEPEWVELFNPGPWTIDLKDVTISDNSSGRVPLSHDVGDTLTPGKMIVIARTEDLRSLLPSLRCLVAPFPSLNNTTPDAVVLRDRTGQTVDSVWYDPSWSSAGRSLERRDWDLSSTQASTWQASEDSSGGTPGRTNSVQRPEIDASCRALTADVAPGTESLHLAAAVHNRGRRTISSGAVDWFIERRGDGTGIELLLLGTTLIPAILPSDSLRVEYRWTEPTHGYVRCCALVRVEGDLRAGNDTAWGSILRPYGSRSLLINEVMLEPAPGKAEWIEVVNASPVPIDLGGWTFADLPSASGSRVRTVLPSVSSVVPPNRMAVIASGIDVLEDYPWLNDDGATVVVIPRSSGFGFNNDGDGIVISDPTGCVSDSVIVGRSAHVAGLSTTGRSLERQTLDGSALDPSAWTSCADPAGATPGRANSVARSEVNTGLRASIFPDPFSPDGDAFEDVAVIAYACRATSIFMDATIFDLSGRMQRRLATTAFMPSSGTMNWDGRTDAGRLVPIGVYIVLLQATDALTGEHRTARLLSVVAR